MHSSQKQNSSKKMKASSYLREIVIRYKKKKLKEDSQVGKKIRGAKQVVELFTDLQNEAKEKLIAISLDAKLKILCFEVVAMGSVSSIYLKPFEALRASIALNASGIILLHNHPSGDPTPSAEDKKFTKQLKKITDLGGMVLHDHIIIGDEDYFSFSEKGLV